MTENKNDSPKNDQQSVIRSKSRVIKRNRNVLAGGQEPQEKSASAAAHDVPNSKEPVEHKMPRIIIKRSSLPKINQDRHLESVNSSKPVSVDADRQKPVLQHDITNASAVENVQQAAGASSDVKGAPVVQAPSSDASKNVATKSLGANALKTSVSSSLRS